MHFARFLPALLLLLAIIGCGLPPATPDTPKQADYEAQLSDQQKKLGDSLMQRGAKDRIAELMKKDQLSLNEQAELGDVAAFLGEHLGGKVTYDEKTGFVTSVAGHEEYFKAIYQKLTKQPVTASLKDPSMDSKPTEDPGYDVPTDTSDPLQQLEVTDWSFHKTRGEPGETTYEVVGELKNHSSQHFDGAYLTVALKDKNGHVVATSTVRADNLNPGRTSTIQGYVIDETNTPNPTGSIEVSNAG